MKTQHEPTIEVWAPAIQQDGKAAMPTLRRPASLEVTEVPISDLADNLSALLAQVNAAFEKADDVPSKLAVHEIELNIGVNAKGGLALIGKVEAGMEAGIKLKLKRRDA
ncbi:MAG TPA: hypothetical protein VGU01_14705 [Sphingomicrobium sp.]|nr:hypothetical protein [Sphingomicrobium sp.]